MDKVPESVLNLVSSICSTMSHEENISREKGVCRYDKFLQASSATKRFPIGLRHHLLVM